MATKLVVSPKTVVTWSDGSPRLTVPPYGKTVTDVPISVLALFLEAFETPREVREVVEELDKYDRRDVEDAIAKLRAIGALEPVPHREHTLDSDLLQATRPETAVAGSEKRSRRSPHSVLLFGPLDGPEAMGLTYIASFLRRNDIEAHLVNTNPLDNAGARLQLVTRALTYYKPTLVGVSLKWYHHIGRVLETCHLVREFDASIQIVIGGNTATQYWRELITYDCVDTVVLGDGEVPMLELARREPYPQNSVRCVNGRIVPARRTYSECAEESDDIYLSHLDEVYTSQLDLYSGAGWFYLGKGCSHQCLYCAGGKDMQKKLFGRDRPFYRGVAAIQKDLEALLPHQQTLRMDFDDRSGPEMSEFFREVLSASDLSQHGLHYYAWGLIDDGLMRLLSSTFDHILIAIDTCSFYERQRLEIARRGLSKPRPADEQILNFLAAADKLPNATVVLSAVAGLPFQEHGDHEQACSFIRLALEHRSLVDIEYLLLEWQPGSLLSDHPGEFGYAEIFADSGEYLKHYQGTSDRPRLRFIDEERNERVEREFSEIQELLGDRTARALRQMPAGDYFSLRDVKLRMRPYGCEFDTTRGGWLGDWLVDSDKRGEPLHITRSAARGMEGSGYIERALDEDRCLIYGNRTREQRAAYRSYSGRLVEGILTEIREEKTVREAFESIRRNQFVSRREFMDTLLELTSYGFVDAEG